MAAATDSALGTVITEGGDLLGSDATSPELVPTGVTPGDYTAAGVYVDAKGRVLYAKSLTEFDFPCATVATCGIVCIGDNITDYGGGEIGIPLATTSSKGVVKIGSGFEMDGCVLNLDLPIATTTTDGMVIVPTSGNLVVDGSGNLSVPLATESSIGVMQVGTGLDVSAGVVSVDLTEVSLPDATESSKGVMQVGTGLDVSAGVVSVDLTEVSLPDATTSTKGVVQIGDNIDVTTGIISVATGSTSDKGVVRGDEVSVNVDGSGVISITQVASPSTIGLIKVGSGLGIDGNGVLSWGGGDATYSSKGIIQVQSGTGLDITGGILQFNQCSDTTKGAVRIGSNMDITGGVLSMLPAENSSLGVVQSADTSHITISSGSIDVGSDVALKDTANTFTKAQATSLSMIVYAASMTPDFSMSNVFEVTLTGDGTINAPTNAVDGGQYIIIIKQDATGGRTLTWGSEFKFSGGNTIAPGANAVSILYVKRISSSQYNCVLGTDYT